MKPRHAVALALFAAVLLAVLLGVRRSTAPQPPVPTTPAAFAPAPPASDPGLLAQVESRLAALERAQRHVESASVPPVTAAPAEPERLTEEAMAARADAADARKVERLEHALAMEPRDPAWADAYETEVMRVLATDVFAGSRLKSLLCRRSVCRLEVEHEDEPSRAAFEAEFAMAAPANQGGFFRRIGSEQGRFESAGYIARLGSKLMVEDRSHLAANLAPPVQ